MSLRRTLFLSIVLLIVLPANQAVSPQGATHLADPFALGWMVVDTNGDGIADFVAGKIVVPDNPTAAECATAANLPARIGYETTGLTPPLGIIAPADPKAGPRLYIRREPSEHPFLTADV